MRKNETPKLIVDCILMNSRLPYHEMDVILRDRFGRGVGRKTWGAIRKRHGLTRPKAGTGPKSSRWNGKNEIITDRGYVRVRVIDENGKSRWLAKHKVEWEKVNGPIPAGMRLLCLGDRADCRPENWALASHSAIGRALLNKDMPLAQLAAELKIPALALAELRSKVKQVRKDRGLYPVNVAGCDDDVGPDAVRDDYLRGIETDLLSDDERAMTGWVRIGDVLGLIARRSHHSTGPASDAYENLRASVKMIPQRQIEEKADTDE